VLKLEINDGVPAFRLSQDGQPVAPWPASSRGYNRFGLWVVLTRQIYSASGALDQEGYVGIFEYDKQSRKYKQIHPPSADPPKPISGNGYRARLVELQFRASGYSQTASDTYPPVPSGVVWDNLFPDSGPTQPDANTVRIVRVSPPIDQG